MVNFYLGTTRSQLWQEGNESKYFLTFQQENDHLPAEPAAPEILDDNGGANDANVGNGGDGNVGDDGQWNPMEWDRAADELTWERLLGLDGSLVFLEHVFWVVSLNTLFILVFGEFLKHIDASSCSSIFLSV